jgi:hypothetical protein
MRALHAEALGDRFADAICRAGDDRDFADQLVHLLYLTCRCLE